MSTVIDFHSHILPGIDDGSACLEESIALLRMEAEQGIRHVVATPHFYPNHDTPERFLARRAEAEAMLREELSRHEGLPQVSIGAEVYFFYGISDSDILSELTIAKKRCIMIEMPHSPWTAGMFRELEDIQRKQGLTPIIAHVDRYISPFRTHQIPERLEQMPVKVQANASFFFRRSTRSMAIKMLRKGQIHLLGSDCHNLIDRKPNLEQEVRLIEQRLGQGWIEEMEYHQNEVLCGRQNSIDCAGSADK